MNLYILSILFDVSRYPCKYNGTMCVNLALIRYCHQHQVLIDSLKAGRGHATCKMPPQQAKLYRKLYSLKINIIIAVWFQGVEVARN